jgi:hypothetical protein
MKAKKVMDANNTKSQTRPATAATKTKKAKKVMDANNTKSQTATPQASAPAAEPKVPAGKRDDEAIAKLLAARGFKFSENYTPKVSKGAWTPKAKDDIQRWEMLESGKFTRDEINLVTKDSKGKWFDVAVKDMKDSGAKPVFRE